LDPLQYETGRNTQENRESVSAALKKGNSRNDTPMSLLFHTNCLRRAVLRRHVLLPRRKNNIYGSQQDRVRHPRRTIQIAGESPIRDAELQSCRNVAQMGDYIFKNGLGGGYRTQARNLDNAWLVRLYGYVQSGYTCGQMKRDGAGICNGPGVRTWTLQGRGRATFTPVVHAPARAA
jgi:hypothetical protein